MAAAVASTRRLGAERDDSGCAAPSVGRGWFSMVVPWRGNATRVGLLGVSKR